MSAVAQGRIRELGLLARDARELGAEREEIVLHAREDRVDRRVEPRRARATPMTALVSSTVP